MTKPPLLMVHGAFCGGWCFDDFRLPFEAAGHDTVALDLPGHGAKDGASAVAGLSLVDYAREVQRWIEACPQPPVLVGHSMGGLVAQLAAVRRPVAGLILLAPSPAWGQPVTSLAELSAAWALPMLRGPYWMQAVEPDYPVVRAYTLDQLSSPEARAVFDRMKPESGRALYEVLNWWGDPMMASCVPAGAIKAPVLVMTGAEDRVHSPATIAPTAARLGVEPAVVPGLSHWSMAGPCAAGVVERCLAWLEGSGG